MVNLYDYSELMDFTYPRPLHYPPLLARLQLSLRTHGSLHKKGRLNDFTFLSSSLNLLSLWRRNLNTTLEPQQRHIILLTIAPRLNRLNRILNLSPVQLPLRQLLQIPPLQPLQRAHLPPLHRQAVQKLAPQHEAGRGRQRLEQQVDVDARAEGGVDGGVEIGGQEDDAAEVLELAQEDGDKLVARDVGGRALRHEDVGFVEQDHGVPFRRHLEDFLDLWPEVGGVSAEIFSLEVVERAACFVGH